MLTFISFFAPDRNGTQIKSKILCSICHDGLIDLHPLCRSARKSLGKETLRGVWCMHFLCGVGSEIPAPKQHFDKRSPHSGFTAEERKRRQLGDQPLTQGAWGPSAVLTTIPLWGKRFLLFWFLPPPLLFPRVHSTEELLWEACGQP